jgi:hypothetical protein
MAVQLHLLNGRPIRKSRARGFRCLNGLTSENWRVAERQLYRVSPTYERSGLELSPFERNNAAASFSVARRSIPVSRALLLVNVAEANQQQTESSMSPHTTSLALEFEFNVLNLNLMAPPRAAPII